MILHVPHRVHQACLDPHLPGTPWPAPERVQIGNGAVHIHYSGVSWVEALAICDRCLAWALRNRGHVDAGYVASWVAKVAAHAPARERVQVG